MSVTFPTRSEMSDRSAAAVPAWPQSARAQAFLVTGVVAVAGAWCYWPTLRTMAERWSSDPQYSHGFLVPLFAAVVLWARRGHFEYARVQPSWWGFAFLVPALVLRLVGASMDFEAADAVSLLPTLAGLVVLVGGWDLLRWSWPAIAFLGFMIPLPFQLDMALAQPLRRIATVASTYLLQTLGFPAITEGNIILIDELRLGVIDACSGLGMLMTFFALATAMALVVKAPRLDRWIIVASAVPIAILANIIRITLTAVAYHLVGEYPIFHDALGWLMMPLAVAVMWLELRFVA